MRQEVRQEFCPQESERRLCRRCTHRRSQDEDNRSDSHSILAFFSSQEREAEGRGFLAVTELAALLARYDLEVDISDVTAVSFLDIESIFQEHLSAEDLGDEWFLCFNKVKRFPCSGPMNHGGREGGVGGGKEGERGWGAWRRGGGQGLGSGRGVGERWEEGGRKGGGWGEMGGRRGGGGRGIRMNHGAFSWGECHFITAQWFSTNDAQVRRRIVADSVTDCCAEYLCDCFLSNQPLERMQCLKAFDIYSTVAYGMLSLLERHFKYVGIPLNEKLHGKDQSARITFPSMTATGSSSTRRCLPARVGEVGVKLARSGRLVPGEHWAEKGALFINGVWGTRNEHPGERLKLELQGSHERWGLSFLLASKGHLPLKWNEKVAIVRDLTRKEYYQQMMDVEADPSTV